MAQSRQARARGAASPPEALIGFLDAHAARDRGGLPSGRDRPRPPRPTPISSSPSNFTLSQRLWDWCAEHRDAVHLRLLGRDLWRRQRRLRRRRRRRPRWRGCGRSTPMAGRSICSTAASRASSRAAAPRPPQWAGLKFFNVYGPNEYHKGAMKSVVAQIYPRAAAGEPCAALPLAPPGHPRWRPDARLRLCRATASTMMLWLYDHPAVSGLFNVGTGAARSFADLAAAVYRALGTRAADRVRRHAGRDPRQIPVFHRGADGAAARRRL